MQALDNLTARKNRKLKVDAEAFCLFGMMAHAIVSSTYTSSCINAFLVVIVFYNY